MNDSPLLSKMDALLQKHRGGPIAPASVSALAPTPAPASGPPPGAWLPVLTDVIERGTPPTARTSASTPAARLPAEPPAA